MNLCHLSLLSAVSLYIGETSGISSLALTSSNHLPSSVVKGYRNISKGRATEGGGCIVLGRKLHKCCTLGHPQQVEEREQKKKMTCLTVG